ncbi:MAG TPA: diaminopimelate decarboxylase [Chitinophagaceae bacterium]|nr:diaminopimelate decarboxylase [Chitinophagaceae bacterium]
MNKTLTNEQLIEAATTYGTPLYVYHAEKIKEQYQKLQTAFEGMNASFFYASKALTNLNVLRYIKSIGSNVDCSSINEVQLALRAGFAPQQVLYTSNGIEFSEIEAAAALGVHINIDSLSNLEKFGKKFGKAYPVGIRIRPNIMAGGNLKIATGHDKSKFGIPVTQLEAIKKLVEKTGLTIEDLHIHTGSEIGDESVFLKSLQIILGWLEHFPSLHIIDLGGGFHIPYHQSDYEIDVNHLAKQIKNELEKYDIVRERKCKLWFEPGKFMVSAAGFLIAKVTVLKNNDTTNIAAVNSGLNHLIRPMMYNAYHFIENISNPQGEQKIYTVTGNICETDTFGEDRSIATIREGDLLAFHNAGAYGFEMASNYNARFKPAEVLIESNTARLIRKRDTLDDLLKNQLF